MYSHSSFAMELQLSALPNIYPPTRPLVYGTSLPVSLDKFSGDVMEYLELKFFFKSLFITDNDFRMIYLQNLRQLKKKY